MRQSNFAREYVKNLFWTCCVVVFFVMLHFMQDIWVLLLSIFAAVFIYYIAITEEKYLD